MVKNTYKNATSMKRKRKTTRPKFQPTVMHTWEYQPLAVPSSFKS